MIYTQHAIINHKLFTKILHILNFDKKKAMKESLSTPTEVEKIFYN